jgi:hypothetical protein
LATGTLATSILAISASQNVIAAPCPERAGACYMTAPQHEQGRLIMTFNIYQASVPAFLQTLNALSGILTKAAAHAEAKKIDPSIFINARLAPDMHPLSRQIQILSDSAKGAVARLAGIDIPSFPDTETTFAELQARIAKTIDFVKSLKPAQFETAATREIVLKVGSQEMKFPGATYLSHFVFPNFYFHATTAYNILRHNGVEIGKRDFIGTV